MSWLVQQVVKKREGAGAGVSLDGDPTGFPANALILSITAHHRCTEPQPVSGAISAFSVTASITRPLEI